MRLRRGGKGVLSHRKVPAMPTSPWIIIAVASVVCTMSCAATLTQADLDRGAEPQPGDEVILDDFSKLTPQTALTKKPERGKWWLRPYVQDGKRGTMLMAVARDMEKPEACIVPQVTYPLSLKGWYEVWIATYRGAYGGGIDVRLSGEDCFVHIDPQQIPWKPKGPKPRVGAIVELNYKPAGDIAGQSLIFQQPYGTYESFHWGFCEAALAYVRLVRLSDEQVEAFKADQARADRRVIAFDDDGFSRFWMWDGTDAHAIKRAVDAFRYHDIAFYGLCMGCTVATRVPTPYTDLYIAHGRRLGDARARRTMAAFKKKGLDMLAISCKRAHAWGFKLLPTLRMSALYHRGPKYRELAQWKLKKCALLDYARPEIRRHICNVIRYFLEHYDVDGFICDFTRHCVHFNPDEPNRVGHMNAFCASLRKMVDEVSAKKGRKLWLAATFSELSYVSSFHRHYLGMTVKASERLAVQGIDVAAWIKNGYFDIIMPEGPNIEKYIVATRGTSTRCFPRWTYTCDLHGRRLGSGVHDPQASEDKRDRPINWHVGPLDYEAGWLKIRRKGADGLYVFNNPRGWVSLRRMGHMSEVAERVKAGCVSGVIEGPVIQFVE